MPYLLDTCAVLFVADNTPELSSETLRSVDSASPGQVFVSAISIAEITCLQERGRISLTTHWRLWWDELLNRTGWTWLPMTAHVMAEAHSLPPPIHRDPADLVLIATARIEKLTLITTDRKILDYPHVATLC